MKPHMLCLLAYLCFIFEVDDAEYKTISKTLMPTKTSELLLMRMHVTHRRGEGTLMYWCTHALTKKYEKGSFFKGKTYVWVYGVAQ